MSPADIRKLFVAAGFPLRDGQCIVATYGDRSQTIEVGEVEDGLLKLSTIVARGAKAREAEFGHQQCFERNCLSELVGLRSGSYGEILAQAWVPTVGVTPELVKLYVHHLALMSDRWEHHLTGEDKN